MWFLIRWLGPCQIDQKAVGDGLESVQLAQRVGGVEDRLESGTGLLHVRPGPLGALRVHGHGEHLNAVAPVLFVELLPYRQLSAARSPGRPEEEH